MTQPSRKIEWALEGAYLALAQATPAMVALLASADSIRREYDLSDGTDKLPAILVSCPGLLPMVERGEGWYVGPFQVSAVTDMRDDRTGSVRADLAGAIRDIFESTGFLAALMAQDATINVGRFSQDGPPQGYDIEATGRRRWDFAYQVAVTMEARLLTTTTTTTTTTAP